jgi:hypothetical protein
VADRITIWEAVSAPESLMIILPGAVFVLPTIVGYTIYSYRVFWDKARALGYARVKDRGFSTARKSCRIMKNAFPGREEGTVK